MSAKVDGEIDLERLAGDLMAFGAIGLIPDEAGEIGQALANLVAEDRDRRQELSNALVEIAGLKGEIEEMREALRFYRKASAEEKAEDGGEVARRALWRLD